VSRAMSIVQSKKLNNGLYFTVKNKRRKKMLTIAGISLALSMLLFLIDKLVDHADVDLSRPARALIFVSLVLLALGYYA
jgi:hypothetical protein